MARQLTCKHDGCSAQVHRFCPITWFSCMEIPYDTCSPVYCPAHNTVYQDWVREQEQRYNLTARNNNRSSNDRLTTVYSNIGRPSAALDWSRYVGLNSREDGTLNRPSFIGKQMRTWIWGDNEEYRCWIWNLTGYWMHRWTIIAMYFVTVKKPCANKSHHYQ